MNDHTTAGAQGGLPAAPPPPPLPAPPTQPVGHAGPSADFSQLAAKLRAISGLDWMGPARVATSILGVAALLAVLIGLGLRPGLPGLHWTLHTTILFFGMLWAEAFGADITAHASAGSVAAHAGVGSMPLTITIFAFGAGILLFRRYTRNLTSARAVFGFALRTAVLTAIPPLVVSWILNADLNDLLQLFGQHDQALGGVTNAFGLTVGFSSWGALFGAFLLTVVTLGCAAITRRDLFDASAGEGVRPLAQIRSFLVGPIIGSAALLVALIPAGAIGAVSVWVFHFGTTSQSKPLTWHEWMNLIAAVIAYAPNIGLAMLSLGSAGKEVYSASTSVMHLSYSQGKGLSYLASNDTGINHGMWVAVILAPAVLATTAYVVLRFSGHATAQEQRTRLVTWLVSTLVTVPVLFHFAAIRAHGTVTGLKGAMDQLDSAAGYGSDSSNLGYAVGDAVSQLATSVVGNTATGHLAVGPSTASVFLVFLYTALITAALAYATGLMTKESLAGLRTKLAYQPAGQGTAARTPPGAAVQYQPGDIVNGHRFTGVDWVPVTTQLSTD